MIFNKKIQKIVFCDINFQFFTQFWPFFTIFPPFLFKNLTISKKALVTLVLPATCRAGSPPYSEVSDSLVRTLELSVVVSDFYKKPKHLGEEILDIPKRVESLREIMGF